MRIGINRGKSFDNSGRDDIGFHTWTNHNAENPDPVFT